MQISPSDVVRVRRARWRVSGVRTFERCQLVTLAGAEPANAGTQRRVLTPFDAVDHINPRQDLSTVSRRVWRRLCRTLIADNVPPGGLRAARHARIDFMPHQLEPALAIVRGIGSRILLADDVGLGKTIEAGLIVSELRAIGAADRVLVLVPAGLRDQWADELSARVGLDAAVMDASAVRRLASTLPVGLNPWRTTPLAIASIDYVRRPDVLAGVAGCPWDVIIVDEAHGVAGNTDRHAAVSALAARAPVVVLVTATPHSGDRQLFASLCQLGNAGTATDTPLLVFRRTRLDVRLGAGRRIHRLHVRASIDETVMHAWLARFARAVRRESGRPDTVLALSVLQKRALSSAWSLQRTIERRLAALQHPEEPARESGDQLLLPLADPGGEDVADDEAPAWPSLARLQDPSEERRMLQTLAGAAERAAKHESKIAVLRRLLRRVSEPVIVFTEFRDTLLHLKASVGDGAVVLHGGLTRQERLAAVREFSTGSRRVLLATDAAGEGLNLHRACRIVVNLELPWNPMRLEQRVGRVDRIGQSRIVHAFHLIARDAGEIAIFNRLRSRVARARADVGAPDPLGEDEGQVAAEDFDVPLLTPGLEADAVEEARRLAQSRLFVREHDRAASALVLVDASGPRMAGTRQWKTRAWLGRRALLLWKVARKDGAGDPVAWTLVPIVVPLPDEVAVDRGSVNRWLREMDDELPQRVEEATRAWSDRVAIVHDAFVKTRLARLHAIGQKSDAHHDAPLFQAGLFDRRAERAQAAILAADEEDTAHRAQQAAALERSRPLHRLAPQLLLVLTP